MLSAADREIRLGIWKIHILHHAESCEVWGTWLFGQRGFQNNIAESARLEAHGLGDLARFTAP